MSAAIRYSDEFSRRFLFGGGQLPDFDPESPFPQHQGSTNGIERRYSADGQLLPLVGCVVDASIEIPVAAIDSYVVNVSGEQVAISESILADQWHLVSVQRSLTVADSWISTDFVRLRALHQLGVQQAIAATVGSFAIEKPRSKSCFVPTQLKDAIDLTDVARDVSQVLCPRLRVAIVKAAREAGFEVVSGPFYQSDNPAIAGERTAAHILGMCYAAIDGVYFADDGAANLSAWLAEVICQAPRSISPASACECSRGTARESQ